MPGVPRSTTNAEMPRWPLVRSVTAMTTITPPIVPCVMKLFEPLSTQPSPWRAADVRIAGSIAAGARLGQAPRAEHLALHQPRQEPPLLRRRSRTSRCATSTGRCARRPTARRRADARQLLDADAVVDRRHRRAAVLFRELDAGQPERRELRPAASSGKCLRFVPLHHVRTDFRFSELPTVRRSSSCSSVGRKSIVRECITGSAARGACCVAPRRLLCWEMHTRPAGSFLSQCSSACWPSLDGVGRHHRVSRRQPHAHESDRPAALPSARACRDRRLRVRIRAHQRGLDEGAPSLRTFMFNGLLQTPVPIAGMQFYGTAGGGGYPRDAQRQLRNERRRRTSAAA